MTLSLDRSAWQKVKFGDVVRQVKASTDPVADGVKRYVAGEHMDSDSLAITRWGMVGDGYLGPAFHRKFKSGHVLYGSRRTYLRKVALADFDGVCANTTFVMESADTSRLLPELLPFVMSTEAFHAHSIAESKGSVNPYVNWPDIARYEFALPPLDQQRRIAELLWLSEEDRMRAKDVIEACRALGRAIYRSTPGGRLVTVRDVVERIEAGKSPLAGEVPAQVTDFGVLKVSAVSSGAFEPEENKILLEPSDFVPEVTVRGGDLLVSRANAMVSNVGVACLVDRDYPNLMLSDKTLRLVPKHGHSRRVLLEALRDAGFRKHVEGSAGGTGAKNISQQGILRGPCRVLEANVEAALEERLLEVDDGVRLSLLLAEQTDRRHHALLTELLGGGL